MHNANLKAVTCIVLMQPDLEIVKEIVHNDYLAKDLLK